MWNISSIWVIQCWYRYNDTSFNGRFSMKHESFWFAEAAPGVSIEHRGVETSLINKAMFHHSAKHNQPQRPLLSALPLSAVYSVQIIGRISITKAGTKMSFGDEEGSKHEAGENGKSVVLYLIMASLSILTMQYGSLLPVLQKNKNSS